jgi:hypothetical protein
MQKVDYSKCKNLNDVATETLSQLVEVYHYDFPEYIRRLPDYLKKCKSYRELGTNQGGSASVALLEKLDYYELVDKSFNNYKPIKSHVETYCRENSIEIKYHEMSSLDVKTQITTDFILIDSVHKYKHVTQEIELYEPLTKKYMMFHDTYGFPGVGQAVKDFLKINKNWNLVEEQTVTPGYMILERVK